MPHVLHRAVQHTVGSKHTHRTRMPPRIVHHTRKHMLELSVQQLRARVIATKLDAWRVPDTTTPEVQSSHHTRSAVKPPHTVPRETQHGGPRARDSICKMPEFGTLNSKGCFASRHNRPMPRACPPRNTITPAALRPFCHSGDCRTTYASRHIKVRTYKSSQHNKLSHLINHNTTLQATQFITTRHVKPHNSS